MHVLATVSDRRDMRLIIALTFVVDIRIFDTKKLTPFLWKYLIFYKHSFYELQ